MSQHRIHVRAVTEQWPDIGGKLTGMVMLPAVTRKCRVAPLTSLSFAGFTRGLSPASRLSESTPGRSYGTDSPGCSEESFRTLARWRGIRSWRRISSPLSNAQHPGTCTRPCPSVRM